MSSLLIYIYSVPCCDLEKHCWKNFASVYYVKRRSQREQALVSDVFVVYTFPGEPALAVQGQMELSIHNYKYVV